VYKQRKDPNEKENTKKKRGSARISRQILEEGGHGQHEKKVMKESGNGTKRGISKGAGGREVVGRSGNSRRGRWINSNGAFGLCEGRKSTPHYF